MEGTGKVSKNSDRGIVVVDNGVKITRPSICPQWPQGRAGSCAITFEKTMRLPTCHNRLLSRAGRIGESRGRNDRSSAKETEPSSSRRGHSTIVLFRNLWPSSTVTQSTSPIASHSGRIPPEKKLNDRDRHGRLLPLTTARPDPSHVSRRTALGAGSLRELLKLADERYSWGLCSRDETESKLRDRASKITLIQF